MKAKKIIALIICIIIVAIIGIAIWYMSRQNETKNNYNESNLFSNNNEQKEEIEITETDDGLVFINGGTFEMGSPENELQRNEDEKQHNVTISDFYIGKYEVTRERISRNNGRKSKQF